MIFHCASPEQMVLEPPPIRTEVEIVVRLPARMPLVNFGIAMDRLTENLGGGDWCYRMPAGKPGRYEVEVHP